MRVKPGMVMAVLVGGVVVYAVMSARKASAGGLDGFDPAYKSPWPRIPTPWDAISGAWDYVIN